MANENIVNRKKVKVILRDDKEYTIEPLTLDELIDIWPLIVKLEKSQDEVTIDLLQDMKALVHKALKGQVAEDKVGELVDLVDIKVIITAIVGQNQNQNS